MIKYHIDKANARGKTGVTLCGYIWKPANKALLGNDIVFYDKEKDLVNCPECAIEWNKQFDLNSDAIYKHYLRHTDTEKPS